MPRYNTRQRKLLLAFLTQHPHEHLTVRQIAQALTGENVSLSAVYRNLAQLEEEKKIRQCSAAGSRERVYQYMDADACRHRLHLFCKQCKRSFHMNEEDAQQLICAVEQRENFLIDRGQTVLYGICEECRHIH